VRIFALSLDLEEDYFDSRTTYPGSDGVFNYYPPRTEEETRNNSVGLGSHTDLQLFTLLWQDMIGGLQILNNEGQWIIVTPIEGTIVVNIGDFMMRLCNDTYKSTVHRVYNQSTGERVSMPFFFGKINQNYIAKANRFEASTSTVLKELYPRVHQRPTRPNINLFHVGIVSASFVIRTVAV